MCGILGQVKYQETIDPQAFKDRLQTLVHRGPDAEGLYRSSDGCVALGHQRLSIIDLTDKGKQPMSNEDETVWITFNGEIYNFKELRKVLEGKGHQFKSLTDTEVIIHSYEEWGSDCVDYFRGMFAFGIWDSRRKRFFLARDPFGIKPLYYYQDPEQFIFASEVKAIIAKSDVPREIDVGALCDFFYYRYIPSPKSIWRDIYKLPPASTLVHEQGRTVIRQYWAPPPLAGDPIDEQQALIKLDELLNESIGMHLVSDVPLGLLLSGGIDSSTIAFYLHKLGNNATAFGVGFDVEDEWYNEMPDARIVAELCSMELQEETVHTAVWELLPQLMWFYDEPFSDGSMFPSYVVSQLARKHMKVALGGEGGDELFAGYNRYFEGPLQVNSKSLFDQLRTLFGLVVSPKETVEYQRGMHPFLEQKDLKRLFHPDLCDEIPDSGEWFLDRYYRTDVPDPKRWQLLDLMTILPEQYLTKIDRASMAHSLEIRVPFLDKPLVEYMLSLPVEVYLRQREKKYLLKKLMLGRLPERILKKRKRGFSIPMDRFWNEDTMLGCIENGPGIKSGLFRKDYVYHLHQQRNAVALHRLWQLAIFDAWYSQWGNCSKSN
jgi:asparagine synthase (glutamine-hydrolysing)